MFHLFLGLANALSETNHNLHTFEFMLGQYRQMAKISPFLVKTSEEARVVGNMSKSESNLSYQSNEEVITQLKVLSDAITMMKSSSMEVSDSTTKTDIHRLKAQHDVSEIYIKVKKRRRVQI